MSDIHMAEDPPKVDGCGNSDYVLLHFSNFSRIVIGCYRQYEDGSGVYCVGDEGTAETVPCHRFGLVVDKWADIPKFEEEYK